MNMTRKIRVLIVDDSSVVRKIITDALSCDPEIEVVGTAPDPYVAREKILELNPDVMTLDMEMPRMDGLTFLKILQKHRPLPVIVISSITQAGSQTALDALEAGAVDVLAKPTSAYSIGHLGPLLASRIKGAAMARRPAFAANVIRQATPANVSGCFDPRQIILIGSSTGGVEALRAVLPQLPNGLPPICIAQHIPPHFSKAVADRLNELCSYEVREATDGDILHPGLALIAPGDFHMILHGEPGHYRVRLTQTPPMHHCRPAVDALFNSAARCAGSHAIAAVLTGMGRDGAAGMQELKKIGARTLAQDEATSVVFGMPRAAIELGVVDRVVPLPHMAPAILTSLRRNATATSNLNQQAA